MKNIIPASIFKNGSSPGEPHPTDFGGERGHGEAALALGGPAPADVLYMWQTISHVTRNA